LFTVPSSSENYWTHNSNVVIFYDVLKQIPAPSSEKMLFSVWLLDTLGPECLEWARLVAKSPRTRNKV
ncbi:MAG: hypothetical protein ACLFQ9_09415, partial [Desulfobacterales bacterium]